MTPAWKRDAGRVLVLNCRMASGSHNAPAADDEGYYWPAGSRFILLPGKRQQWPGRVGLEQIGGEEVIVTVPALRFSELFSAAVPAVDQTQAGAQYMVGGTEGRRAIPAGGIAPRRVQSEAPLPLEMVEDKQAELFKGGDK